MRSFFPDRPQQGQHNLGWWLAAWTPAAFAVAVICVESTSTFSARSTSTWLRPVFERVFGAFRDDHWELFHHYLRKTGHFLGYGTVALTFLRAWLYTLGRSTRIASRTWIRRANALAIASTVLVACCDELHQSFLPSRTGTPVDVLLDACGGCVLCLLVWLVRFRTAPRPQGTLIAGA